MSQVPWWHPQALAARRPALAARGRATQAVRGWFAAGDFVEVEVPALAASPGLEPHLMSFATELRGPDRQVQRTLHLATSPEFACKKLLAGGVPRLFTLARAYRNGERSATHHPEFTMLEWYRAGEEGVEGLVADCAGLVAAAAEAVGSARLTWGGVTADPAAPIEALTLSDAFDRWCDIDLAACMIPADAPEPGPLAEQARRRGLHVAPDDRWEDVFFRLMAARIEPHLGQGQMTALVQWPASMAALARLDPDDPRWARRAELYAAGLELANGFDELTDAPEQARRFAQDQALAERLYGEAAPADPELLEALAFGLPRAAGMALGFDRLVMLLTGAERIEDVLWAPVPG